MERPLVCREVRDAHRKAMEAKERIFRAQDAMARAPLPVPERGRAGSNLRAYKAFVRKVDRALAKLRTELEAFDRLVRDARRADWALCTCEHDPEGTRTEHQPGCPLWYGHEESEAS